MNRTPQILLSLGALALAACGADATQLRVAARSAPSAGSPATALSAGPLVDVTRVEMVVDRVKLYRGPVDGSGGDLDVTAGPYLLDLQGPELDGGVRSLFTVEVPDGTYDRVKLRIHRLEDTSTALPQMIGVAGGPYEGSRISLRIQGTHDGNPFVFESTLDEEQEYFGSFVMDAGQVNQVTLAIDPTVWFRDLEDPATSLDPRDEANRSKIHANIKGSIDAFDDDDGDGSPN